MFYRCYKKSYADCEALPGSYDKETKSIIVKIPDGRKKKSGVRGKSYSYFHFDGIENGTGRKVTMRVKAICLENAIKRLPNNCLWNLQ